MNLKYSSVSGMRPYITLRLLNGSAGIALLRQIFYVLLLSPLIHEEHRPDEGEKHRLQ
jgi:hypothetical protein